MAQATGVIDGDRTCHRIVCLDTGGKRPMVLILNGMALATGVLIAKTRRLAPSRSQNQHI
ncbi:MAG: hypothetical protein JWM11_8002 [Planctomycetaceae bacterium]|nr:hypothetical protein [Planctomycetaceae bacterium]